MGIHNWSKSAVLTLLVVLSIGHAHAATRKTVSMPSDGQVIGSGGGSSKSGGTLSVPGQPLDGEYIPSSYGGGSKGTKLPIKPTYDYSIPRTVKGMTTNLRGGVYGAVLGIGLQYMLDAVDGVIEDGQVKIRAESQPVPGGYYWKCPQVQCTPQLSLRSAVENSIIVQGIDIETHQFQFCDFVSETYGYCVYRIPHPTVPDLYSQVDYVANRFGTGCSEGSTYNTSTGACESADGLRPATDADYDLMEAAAAAKDSEWLKDRLREHCEGSLNPQGCYDDLRENTWLEGPASVTEPGPTVSTTGPAGTTTTTNNTKIDITYGDNYYYYRKTKTSVVTKPDGTTETTTETEPETEQPPEEEPEGSFTDSALPQIEPFYDPIYKVGVGGVWQQRMTEIDNSPFIDFMHSFVPSFSSSCPAFSLGFNIASWANYGTVSFWNLCWIFDFIKVCMLVTAAFLCRALIFGG